MLINHNNPSTIPISNANPNSYQIIIIQSLPSNLNTLNTLNIPKYMNTLSMNHNNPSLFSLVTQQQSTSTDMSRNTNICAKTKNVELLSNLNTLNDINRILNKVHDQNHLNYNHNIAIQHHQQ